jgi:glyoxylase-like metal-dependent hydrolase (beta-lactamase superfamily II)
MLRIERFVNELMTSNCYVVWEEESRNCIVIDPGSEKSEKEIEFINELGLQLNYIIITHEHTDHNWGVNALREHYASSKLVCSSECNKRMNKANKMYFLFYYDKTDYSYTIDSADIQVLQDEDSLEWGDRKISFFLTPGHSWGSMCIQIDNYLFTGDTIMPYPPYFNGRDSNKDEWRSSIKHILDKFNPELLIYPGHGDTLTIKEWADKYFI